MRVDDNGAAIARCDSPLASRHCCDRGGGMPFRPAFPAAAFHPPYLSPFLSLPSYRYCSLMGPPVSLLIACSQLPAPCRCLTGGACGACGATPGRRHSCWTGALCPVRCCSCITTSVPISRCLALAAAAVCAICSLAALPLVCMHHHLNPHLTPSLCVSARAGALRVTRRARSGSSR